jgi:hypothetical protein
VRAVETDSLADALTLHGCAVDRGVARTGGIHAGGIHGCVGGVSDGPVAVSAAAVARACGVHAGGGVATS